MERTDVFLRGFFLAIIVPAIRGLRLARKDLLLLMADLSFANAAQRPPFRTARNLMVVSKTSIFAIGPRTRLVQLVASLVFEVAGDLAQATDDGKCQQKIQDVEEHVWHVIPPDQVPRCGVLTALVLLRWRLSDG